ncbi:MAG: bifunctional folylpolyglutamate synthase/dihydrofolate synthase [Spirulina sp. SIO3F2]|nr:bifunctional folylpolyglutamate synthase/dihydrofolate synthase [Spirulina sp. SIO3F2]
MSIEQLLAPYKTFGVNLGLARIQSLLAQLDNPHQRVPILHVAGTNGKGSVCAYLSAILTAAGYRVGRYTSPHLVSWTERFVLQEQPIALPDLEALLQRVLTAIAALDASHCPTVFEIVTAAAWLYFAEQQVDVAVMEVGLGGRLDATNVSNRPLVSIITSLGLDHCQQLGPTLAHIATEKAGILRALCPAVLGQFPPEAKWVVQQQLTDLQCPTQWIEPAIPSDRPGWAHWQGLDYPLPLAGVVQLQNSALALGAIDSLRTQGWQISDTAIVEGMKRVRWPGRLQWLTWQGQQLLIDGAHNPAAAQGLRDYLDTLPPQPIHWIMGILATKDSQGILQALLKPGDRLTAVPVPGYESTAPDLLQARAIELGLSVDDCESVADVFIALSDLSSQGYRVVLCGSLYLLGHVLSKTQNSDSECLERF